MQDLRRRPTLNELTTYLQVGQPKIKYPDRTATRLRNSHYLMQFDGNLLNIEEQEKTIEKNKLAQNELNRISQTNPNTPFKSFIGTEEDPEVIESYGVEQEISERKSKSAETIKGLVKSDLGKIKEEESFVKKLSKKAQKAEDRFFKTEAKKEKEADKATVDDVVSKRKAKQLKAESIAKIKAESKELEKQIKAEDKAKAKADAKAARRIEAKEAKAAVAAIKEAEKIEAKQVMAAVKIAEAQKTPPKGLITDKSVSQWRMMTKDTIKEQLELRGVFFNRIQVEGLDTTERGVTKKNKKMTKEDYLRELFKVL